MIDHEQKFVNNLLRVVKDLEAIERAKRCREEYWITETSNEEKTIDEEKKRQQANDEPPDLTMDVFDDPEYDVEQVRQQNFLNKIKSASSSATAHQTKPNMVRTLIFRAPESSYIVRKCPVYVEVAAATAAADKSKLSEKKRLLTVDQSVQTEVIKKPIASSIDPNAKRPAALDKCDMEDLIVMEDDDDILNYEDDVDNLEEVNESASRVKKIDRMTTNYEDKEFENEEEDGESEEGDDDDEDEEYRPAAKKSCKRKRSELAANASSGSGQRTRRRSSTKSAKVVMERAVEPISTITVSGKRTVSRRQSSVSAQSSELYAAESAEATKSNEDGNKSKRGRPRKSTATRDSETSRSKTAKVIEIELSSSMSSVATSIATETTSQTGTRRSLRVTRSRSKLTTDQ